MAVPPDRRVTQGVAGGPGRRPGRWQSAAAAAERPFAPARSAGCEDHWHRCRLLHGRHTRRQQRPWRHGGRGRPAPPPRAARRAGRVVAQHERHRGGGGGPHRGGGRRRRHCPLQPPPPLAAADAAVGGGQRCARCRGSCRIPHPCPRPHRHHHRGGGRRCPPPPRPPVAPTVTVDRADGQGAAAAAADPTAAAGRLPWRRLADGSCRLCRESNSGGGGDG